MCVSGFAENMKKFLFEVNPFGKLAETFPYKLSNNLLYFNFPGEEGTPWYKGVSQTPNV